MPGALDVAIVVAKVEPVRNRNAVIDFPCKGARRISLIVRQVFCQRVVRLEIQAVAQPMRRVHLKRLIVLRACVEGAVEGEPVRIRSPWINVGACRGGAVRSGAGRDLVQVLGDVEAIGVHANVADTQCGIGLELAFHSQVPLF